MISTQTNPTFQPEITRPTGSEAGGSRNSQAGFTLSELLVVVYVLGLLAVMAINTTLDAIEKARLARCIVELMSPKTFWDSHFHGTKPGPYYYLVDGDPNAGHGNDIDDIDEQNPGDSADNRTKKDIKFVVVCQHDHKHLANYVYGEDQDGPKIAYGGDDPQYDRFVKWEFNAPGAAGKGDPGGGRDKGGGK